MTRSRSRRCEHQRLLEGDETEEDGGRYVQVSVLTRGPTLVLIAALVAIAYLADWPPPRDLELAASCKGLTGYVQSMTVDDDGAVWACSSNMSLTIWEPASGHGRTIDPGAYGHGGAPIAHEGAVVAAEERGPAAPAIDDGLTGRGLCRLGQPGPRVVALAVGREGGRVASSDLAGVDLFDFATGRRAGSRLNIAGAIALALAPDGQSLALGSADGTIQLRDPTATVRSRSFQAHASAILSLAFSDDGLVLASSSSNSDKARVWQASTGRLLAEVNGRSNLQRVALSSGGRLLATAGRDGVVRVWDVATGRLNGVSSGHEGAIMSMAFSPHGIALACGGVGSIRWYRVRPPDE